MRRLAIPVVVGLAVGIALGLIVARSGAATGDGELTDLRLWLLGVAVLSLLATGPVAGALTGLAAMVGVLGTLELTPFVIDTQAGKDFDRMLRDLADDTSWLDPLMLAGAALAGAAVGTARLVVRTGKRLVLVVVAVAVLAVVVLGAPQLSDLPFAPTDEIAIIR